MTTYTTLDDVIRLFRELKPDEIERAEALIPTVEAKIRREADAVGKDLDDMAQDDILGPYLSPSSSTWWPVPL